MALENQKRFQLSDEEAVSTGCSGENMISNPGRGNVCFEIRRGPCKATRTKSLDNTTNILRPEVGHNLM